MAGILSGDDISKGSRSLLDKLEDVRVDVPKAPEQLADVLSMLISCNLISFATLMKHIREADMEPASDGEDTLMIDSGTAKSVVGHLLQGLVETMGVEKIADELRKMDLDILNYFPSFEREEEQSLSEFVKKFELTGVF